MAEQLNNVYVRQKMVTEDIVFGLDKIVQIRQGKRVEGTKVNAHMIPYDETQSIGDVLDLLLAAHSG